MCKLNNATDCISLKTKALIDGGAHMVLIFPDIATHLALPKLPLTNPEHVNVAMGAPNQLDMLTHYVIIEPSSLNRLFISHPVHTVIAPGLCMPLILGLPFLVTNKVICNYVERTCIATENIPQYNLLLKTKTMPRLHINADTPDILATLKEQIITLSLEEELAAQKTEICTHFAHIFEATPHVDELPIEPVARIRLKDQNHVIKS